MAITRAQQVRQMLEDGGMLVKPSTDGKRPGYRSAKAQEAQGRDTGSDYGQFDRAVSRSQNNPSRTTSSNDGGGGDNKVDVGFQEALRKQEIEKKKKEARDAGFRTTGSQVYSPPTTFQKFKDDRIQNAINRNKYLALQKTGLISGGGFKGFAGSLIDGLFGKVPENLQDLTEEELTELAFEVQKFKDAGGPINQATYNYNLNPTKKGSGLELLGRTFDAQDLLDSGQMTQTKFEELFPGPDIPEDRDGPEQDPCKGPNPPAYCFIGKNADENMEVQKETTPAYRFFADGGSTGGIMNADMIGGMMDGNMDEMGRQMYGLGKLVKKATRGIKKLVKSPVGKIALGAAAFKFGMPFLKSEGLKNFFFKGGEMGLKNLTQKGLFTGLAGISALPLLFGQEEEEDYDPYRGPDIDIANIRSDPYAAMGQAYRFAADGGIMRSAYQEGGDAEPVAKKTMPLIDMDGKEKDYRETGGFVDMGRMERADDVPARLSKNEFVFTADAVRNAGEGDIDKGAEVMYNMMKNLEAGGEVSEESQGLEGAREMFQTSQRLGEVI